MSNVVEFCMRLIVFHGKYEIEKSEKSTKKRDSWHEKRDLDFSLSQHVGENIMEIREEEFRGSALFTMSNMGG